MKRLTYLLPLAAAVMLASCDRLDIAGMLVSSGSHTEDRVAMWLDWNAEQGEPVINGVPDEYSVYFCSDPHLNDSTDRMERFLTQECNDSKAIFAVINGDIANEGGERPYRLLDSVIRMPKFHTPAPKPVRDTCFAIIGNHDLYFDCEQYFQQYFHTSTYTVTVNTLGGAKDLFIFLDSGNGTHGRRQTEWLKEKLSHRSEYRHVVVATHTCLFRTSYNYSTTPAANLPLDEYYELTKLMDDSDVTLFVMGHFHYREERMIGNVPYVMTDNLDEDVEAPSYMIVTLGNEMTCKFKEL